MTPEEAVHHEWLQPSSSSSTFIITSSTSASSLMKHNRDQLKENDQSQQQLIQKYQRSQPITPLTILPQIKTPSNRVTQRYAGSTINGTKDSSRVKGENQIIKCHWTSCDISHLQSWHRQLVNWTQRNSSRNSIKSISSKTSAKCRRPTMEITSITITIQCSTRLSPTLRRLLRRHWMAVRASTECRTHKAPVTCQPSLGVHDTAVDLTRWRFLRVKVTEASKIRNINSRRSCCAWTT